jgi:cytochrome c biogenesis protein CcdA/thiol-disulfide isomerase/thioredoxin
MLLLIGFAFLAGIVTILSPCILPILPIILAGTVEGKRSRPLGIVSGFIASFTFFTLTLSLIVQSLGINPNVMRWIAAFLIIVFGLILVIPKFKDAFVMLASRLSNRFARKGTSTAGTSPSGFWNGFILGTSLGLVWTPCVGPIMASVVSLALSSTINTGSVLITLAYSMGTAVPLFFILYGGRTLLNRFPFFLRNTESIQRVFGGLMILTGLIIFTGFINTFQSWVLQTFPKYGSGLTAIEDNQSVREELSKQKAGLSKASSMIPSVLDPFTLASGTWINSKPLSLTALKGKVVLVDFWTYSCINCLRTLPYLKAWQDAYGNKGLVIVGVHSPEFAFERSEDNVRRAVKDLGVNWPVVQDNSFAVWKSFSNNYWPAHYLFDRTGALVDLHFGEGKYIETEKMIQKLLGLSGPLAAETVNAAKADEKTRSPETYIGYARAQGYAGNEDFKPDIWQLYTQPAHLDESSWAFEGVWLVTAESAENQGPASLTYHFAARKVYLVMNPVKGASDTVKVTVDGKPVNGGDVKNGILKLDKNRLYQLYDGDSVITGTIRLEFSGSVKVFAFTFG